jgi:hypothetical protein
MRRMVKAYTTMRIDPEKLSFLESLGKTGSTYDGIVGKIIDYLKKQPNFEKELLLA